MQTEFDPVALEALITEALAEDVRPSAAVVLSHYEGALLERLAGILGPAARKEILTKLRQDLFIPVHATYDAFAAEVARCARCPGISPRPGATKGNVTDPDLLVVVEFLNSRDGDDVLALLDEAGVSRDRVAMTGATRCPGASAKEDVDRCLQHLVAEVELLRPQLILTIGKTATQALLGSDVKIGQARSQVWWSHGWAIMATYSPGYGTHGGKAESDVRADMAAVRRYLDG
jgi:uracil-DNA glycosylase family 4